MSLSQEPALTTLKKYFVCGTRDISGEPYAGMSGLHDNFGKAVHTSNGAGPHNIQMFVLASDGTVLTCLPGYWSPEDLVTELRFAAQLNAVWTDPKLSHSAKDRLFGQMHMEHIKEHSPAMMRRSQMQGFDQRWEAEHNPGSDTIRDQKLVQTALANGWHGAGPAFKTTDVIMHERMARRAFEKYERFDVATFSEYGQTKYDKQEDQRMANGEVDHEAAHYAPTIGSHKPKKEAEDPQRAKQWGTKAGWGAQE